jgi:hypothetical protein
MNLSGRSPNCSENLMNLSGKAPNCSRRPLHLSGRLPNLSGKASNCSGKPLSGSEIINFNQKVAFPLTTIKNDAKSTYTVFNLIS